MCDINQKPEPTESAEVTATLYSALQALTIHSQENKTFTLYNFFLFNSILLMSWATIFSQQKVWTDKVASCLLCGVGIAAAIAWTGLKKDYASASDLFRRRLENAEAFLPQRWRGPAAARSLQIEVRDTEASKTRVGDRDLSGWSARAFSVAYVALLLLSLAKPLDYAANQRVERTATSRHVSEPSENTNVYFQSQSARSVAVAHSGR